MALYVVAMEYPKKGDKESSLPDQPREQINLLVKKLTDIYSKVKEKDPDARIVVSWEEHLIHGAPREDEYLFKRKPHLCPLVEEETEYFKKVFKELSNDCPDLIIVAGAVATQKTIGFDKLEASFLRAGESEMSDKIKKFSKEVTVGKGTGGSIERAVRDMQIMRMQRDREEKQYSQIRNTSYVFHNGQKQRHDKLAVFHETPDNWVRKIPKEEKSMSCQFSVSNNNSIPITIGVEICFEHQNGLLKSQLREEKREEEPFLHFILSDTTSFVPENSAGRYVIHIDSLKDTMFMDASRLNQDADEKVVFYRCNLRDKESFSLNNPTLPIRSNSTLEEIENLLKKTVKSYEQQLQKSFFVNAKDKEKRKIMVELTNCMSSTLHQDIMTRISNFIKIYLDNLEFLHDQKKKQSLGFFKTVPPEETFCKEINSILTLLSSDMRFTNLKELDGRTSRNTEDHHSVGPL